MPEKKGFQYYHRGGGIESCWHCKKPIEGWEDRAVCFVKDAGFYPFHKACVEELLAAEQGQGNPVSKE